MREKLTNHAIERYRERVRPALDFNAVRVELGRLLGSFGERLEEAPGWADVDEREVDYWLALGNEVVFPVRSGFVVSCIVPAAPPAKVREKRNEKRRARARKRKYQAKLRDGREARVGRTLRGRGEGW